MNNLGFLNFLKSDDRKTFEKAKKAGKTKLNYQQYRAYLAQRRGDKGITRMEIKRPGRKNVKINMRTGGRLEQKFSQTVNKLKNSGLIQQIVEEQVNYKSQPEKTGSYSPAPNVPSNSSNTKKALIIGGSLLAIGATALAIKKRNKTA